MHLQNNKKKATKKTNMKAIEVNDQTFDKTITNTAKTVVVDFSAEWCGPCKKMTPVINQLAEKLHDVAIISKLDVDSNPLTTAKYGVRNMPTFLIFKNGELVDRIIGAVPGKVLEDRIHAAGTR